MSLDDDSPLACDEQCEEQTLDSRAIEVQGQEDDKMAADDCLEPRKNTLAVEDLAQADVAMQRQLEEWACEEIGADGTFSEEASTLEDKSLAVLLKQEQPVELVEAEMPAPSVSPSAGFDVIDAEDSSPLCPKAAAAIDSKTAAGKFMDQSPEPTVGQELHPVVCCEAEVGTGMGSSLSSFGQVAVAAEPAHALPAGMHLPKVDVLPDSEQGQKPAPEATRLPAEGNQYPELRCQTHLEFSMSLDDDSPLACDEQCEEQTLDSRAIEVQGQEDDKMAADDCLEPRKNTLAVEDLAQADVAMQRQLEEWACEEIGADGTFSEEASTLEDKSLAVLSKQEQPVGLVEAEMPAPSVSPSAGFDVIDAEDSSPLCPKAAAAIDSKTAVGKFMDQSPEPTVGQELHPVVCCEAEVGTGMGSSLSSFGQVAVAAEPAHALPTGMHLPKVDVLPDSEQGQKPAPEATRLPAEGNQYPELRCQTHLEFSMSLDDDSPLACDEQCEEQTLDSRAIEVQGQEDDKMAADDCLEPRKNTLAVEDLAQADVAMQRQLEEWACEEIGADGTFSEEASTLEDKSLAVLSKQEQPVELVEAEMPAPSVSPSAGFDVIDAEDSSPHCPKAAAAIDSKTAAGKFMDQSPEPTVGQELHPVVCCEAEVGTGMGSSLSSFGQVAVAAEPAHALPAGMHLPKVDVLPDSEQGQKPAPEVNEGQKLRHSASTPCLKTVQSKKVACRPKPEAAAFKFLLFHQVDVITQQTIRQSRS